HFAPNGMNLMETAMSYQRAYQNMRGEYLRRYPEWSRKIEMDYQSKLTATRNAASTLWSQTSQVALPVLGSVEDLLPKTQLDVASFASLPHGKVLPSSLLETSESTEGLTPEQMVEVDNL